MGEVRLNTGPCGLRTSASYTEQGARCSENEDRRLPPSSSGRRGKCELQQYGTVLIEKEGTYYVLNALLLFVFKFSPYRMSKESS